MAEEKNEVLVEEEVSPVVEQVQEAVESQVQEAVETVENQVQEAVEAVESQVQETVGTVESQVQEAVETIEEKPEAEQVQQESADPISMQEIDLEQLNLPQFEIGQEVVGTVSALAEKHAVVVLDNCDLNCIIPISELSLNHIEKVSDAVTVGDEVKLVVTKLDSNAVVLSKKKIDFETVWAELEAKQGEIIETTVKEVVKGGLVVDVGLRGFVPASMVDDHFVEDLAIYQDQVLTFKIMEMDKEKGRVILSHREVVREEKGKAQSEALKNLQVGTVVDGTVVRLTKFGAFVDIGVIEGLVHVSQISHEHIQSPSDVLSAGEQVQVKILKIDPTENKVSLSIKDTLPGPWELHADLLKVGQVLEGKVKRLAGFGAFVEILPGIEGLVHISQISHQHITTPHEVLKEGGTVQVKILKVDSAENKVSLSIKELLENEENFEFEIPQEATGFSIGELFSDKLSGFKVVEKPKDSNTEKAAAPKEKEEKPKAEKATEKAETPKEDAPKVEKAKVSEFTAIKVSSSDTVYFTPSGKSYHSTESCSRLAKSKKISAASLEEAQSSGHADPCDYCVEQ